MITGRQGNQCAARRANLSKEKMYIRTNFQTASVSAVDWPSAA